MSPERVMRVLGKHFSSSQHSCSDQPVIQICSVNPLVIQLVELPQTNMAVLLHAFLSTLSMARGRSKEPIIIIRDAAEKGLSGAIC